MDDQGIGEGIKSPIELGSDGDAGNGKPSIADNGNASATGGFVDPTVARSTGGTGTYSGSGATGGTPGPVKRGPGRPRLADKPASSPTPKTEKRNLNVNGIEKILFSIHAVGAAMLQIPELAIGEDDAKKLSAAIAGVNEQYKLALDPKKAAWIELAQALGIVYGPMGVSIYMRKSATPKPASIINAPNAKQEPKKPQGFDPAKINIMN